MKTKNVTEKNMKVCLVGSSGGHLTHLYMLKPFWKDKNRFWVTFDTSRVGDLTVGDFWGIAKSHPSFNSPKGVSSVFVNTEKGQKLFEMMRVLAEVEEATLEEGMVKQHNLVQPSNRPVTRDTFYKSVDEPGFIENIKVGFQPKARLKSVLPNKLIQKIKSL
jgi:hypothetical protein